MKKEKKSNYFWNKMNMNSRIDKQYSFFVGKARKEFASKAEP